MASNVDFIEKMLFSEPSWLTNARYRKMGMVVYEREKLDNGIIKQMILTQPYYRKALEKIRTEVEQLRASTKSTKKGAKPKPSILHRGAFCSLKALGWPNRRKVLVQWFGASLNDPEVLEKVKQVDDQLSLIKEDAYVQFYINDGHSGDGFAYLSNQWQPSEEEEEEHKFNKFLSTNFFLKDFLREEPDVADHDLEMLEVLTRPLLRAQARNLYLRMQQTLDEALARTEAAPTRRPEDDTRCCKLHGVRFFFGRALDYDDVFAKAQEYADEARGLQGRAEDVCEGEGFSEDMFGRVAKPPKPIMKATYVAGFVSRWLMPDRDDALNEAEKEKKKGLIRSLCTSPFLRRVRGLKIQFDEIMALGHESKAQGELSQQIKEQVNNINPHLVSELGAALNDPKVWLNVKHFGETSGKVMESINEQYKRTVKPN